MIDAKRKIKVGDYVRNIESHWLGRVREVEAQPDGGTMLVCYGVNFWTGTEDEDDKQWHAPEDVQLSCLTDPDPVNPINMM